MLDPGALTTAGCKQKVESPPPELRILSDAEADKMFDAAGGGIL